MKKRTLAIIIAAVALTAVGVGAVTVAGPHLSEMFQVGQHSSAKIQEILSGVSTAAEDGDEVVAMFGDTAVYRSALETQRMINKANGAAESTDDQALIDQILMSAIMVEEAERRGLTVTEEEIDELVEAGRQSYEYPEGKEAMDAYCQGAGISIEDYFDLLRKQAPRIIARGKLQTEFGKEYCTEHGLDYAEAAASAEVNKAIQDQLTGLLDKYRSEITYAFQPQK